jgi:uncharacterized protein YecT (DUF1311 family)
MTPTLLRWARQNLLQAAALAALALALALQAAPAVAQPAPDPIDTHLNACLAEPAGQSTAGMVTCTSEALRAWDQRLNDVYQQTMKALDPKSRDLLRTAQRQWVAFRKAEGAAQRGPWTEDRGSIIRLQIMGKNLAALKARVSELQLYQEP